MDRDQVFSGTSARGSDFEFNNEVAAVFDDMLVRSIPFYLEQRLLIEEITQKFWLDGTTVYDLGDVSGEQVIGRIAVLNKAIAEGNSLRHRSQVLADLLPLSYLTRYHIQ